MDRSQKEQAIEALRGDLSSAQIMLVLHQHGLTVAQSTELRRNMSKAGVRFKVVKNRLAQRAIKGTEFENLSDMLKGPTMLALSADPVAPAKVANEFIKTNDKLALVGASFSGNVLDIAAVKTLATLPSLDELRAKLVGLIAAPATKVACVLQAPAGQIARVINAHATKSS